MSINKKRKTVVEEPCTLVYTLTDYKSLSFDDFSLLIRGMHSYMVEDITAFPDSKSMHVKLGYQASIENATKKLGDLAHLCVVSKLSTFVKDTEIQRLNELKMRFNIAGPHRLNVEEASSQPRTWKEPPRRYHTNSLLPEEI